MSLNERPFICSLHDHEFAGGVEHAKSRSFDNFAALVSASVSATFRNIFLASLHDDGGIRWLFFVFV